MHCPKVFKNGRRCNVILCPHHDNQPRIPVSKQQSKHKKSISPGTEEIILQSLMEYNIERERRLRDLPMLRPEEDGVD